MGENTYELFHQMRDRVREYDSVRGLRAEAFAHGYKNIEDYIDYKYKKFHERPMEVSEARAYIRKTLKEHRELSNLINDKMYNTQPLEPFEAKYGYTEEELANVMNHANTVNPFKEVDIEEPWGYDEEEPIHKEVGRSRPVVRNEVLLKKIEELSSDIAELREVVIKISNGWTIGE